MIFLKADISICNTLITLVYDIKCEPMKRELNIPLGTEPAVAVHLGLERRCRCRRFYQMNLK